jgi:hypothetical protein
VTLFFAFYFGANNATISPLKFPAAIQGELTNFVGINLVGVAVVLTIGFIGFHLYLVTSAYFFSEIRSDSVFIFVIGAGLSGVILTIAVESLFGSQIYFLHSASIFLLIIAVSQTVNLCSSLRQQVRSKFIFGFLVIIGFFAASSSLLIPSLNSGSIPAIALRLSKSLVILVPILAATIFALKQEKAKKFITLFSLGAIGVASMSVSFSGVNWFSTLQREFSSYERNAENNLGTQQLTSAMNWLRESSNPDDIFASNDESFLLSALSHRRGFLQAEYLTRRHTASSENWSREINQRKELLAATFLNPSLQNLEVLRQNQVRWVILDKSKVLVENYFNFKEKSFENNGYVILDLDLLG